LPLAEETPSVTATRVTASRAERFAVCWSLPLQPPFTAAVAAALSLATGSSDSNAAAVIGMVRDGVPLSAAVLHARSTVGLPLSDRATTAAAVAAAVAAGSPNTDTESSTEEEEETEDLDELLRAALLVDAKRKISTLSGSCSSSGATTAACTAAAALSLACAQPLLPDVLYAEALPGTYYKCNGCATVIMAITMCDTA
jgi:hypothetical protein